MTPLLSARRSFLRRLGSFWLATNVPRLGSASDQPGLLAHAERAALTALVDTLIPRDNEPGAIDTGVVESIEQGLRRHAWWRQHYERVLAWLDQTAHDLHNQPFGVLDLTTRTQIVHTLYDSTSQHLRSTREALDLVRRHAFQFFYTSPAGERLIAYHPPVAGGYPDYAAPPDARCD